MGKPRQPGDLILDRHMPNASAEAREEARDNLRALVGALMRINRRLIADSEEPDSHKSQKDSML